MLRSPAELYIKYLLVHPDGYDNAQIIQICEDTGVDVLGERYLEWLRNRCDVPKPFYPNDTMHARSQRFLLREGLRPFFHPTDDLRVAFKILGTPRAKEFVEAMILSHAPIPEIAFAVTRHKGIACTQQAMEQYKKFFWNIEILDSTQMRTLLHYRQNLLLAEDGSPKEDRALYDAVKKASYLDPRRLAADMPYSPMTALMTQMRMGALPDKMEIAKSVEMVRAIAVLRTAEAALYGSPKDSITALNFSNVARNMTEMLEVLIKPDEDLREQLQAVALRTENGPIPSIHQLSAGRHTVDVQPTVTKEHPNGPGTSAPEDGGH
jgi:hypothetical protein